MGELFSFMGVPRGGLPAFVFGQSRGNISLNNSQNICTASDLCMYMAASIRRRGERKRERWARSHGIFWFPCPAALPIDTLSMNSDAFTLKITMRLSSHAPLWYNTPTPVVASLLTSTLVDHLIRTKTNWMYEERYRKF